MPSKEPVAEEDSNSFKGQKSLKKPALIIVVVVLGAVILAIIPVLLFSGEDNKPLFECSDNLRAIDTAILSYEAEHGEGVFPETIDELVPTYLRKIPKEPDGGYYYLDFTSRRPRASCSKGHTY